METIDVDSMYNIEKILRCWQGLEVENFRPSNHI
jgi:hypothetical protein